MDRFEHSEFCLHLRNMTFLRRWL